MDKIFDVVYKALMGAASMTGLTYFEINIIVYYIIIPFIYVILIDKIFRFHYVKMGFVLLNLILFFIINNFRTFSEKLFIFSQDFLLLFEPIGINYIVSSIIFCVVVPLIILFILIRMVRKRKPKKVPV